LSRRCRSRRSKRIINSAIETENTRGVAQAPRNFNNRIREIAMFSPRPIGHVQTPYQETKEIPKGLGARHDAVGVIEIFPEFEAGLLDIEGFSHLVILWVFDRALGFELVGTPPADDRPHGVFATRSPRRPNPIGLTVVELLRREGRFLHVRGVDMLDRTPILDLKPYLSSIPAEKLRRGWLAEAESRSPK
jgi:tRNA-Thr(GGU) m(6)t(6)A37 methyltransferase TsaA